MVEVPVASADVKLLPGDVEGEARVSGGRKRRKRGPEQKAREGEGKSKGKRRKWIEEDKVRKRTKGKRCRRDRKKEMGGRVKKEWIMRGI